MPCVLAAAALLCTTLACSSIPNLSTIHCQQELSELCRLLEYLAEQKVNGPKHPGATGNPPAKVAPALVPLPAGMAAGATPTGWRDLLVAEGPEAWSKAVREHRQTKGAWVGFTA